MKLLAILLRRSAFALLLAAFILPSPMRAPAGDARAQAIALGLLCVADGSDPSAPHASGHCVLCLTPATGAAPETLSPCRDEQIVAASATQTKFQHPAHPRPAAHRPRAPPSLPV